MRLAGQTDIGKSRDENQDSYRSANLNEAGAFAVVCDGMGGAAHGRLASTLAADVIAERLTGGLSPTLTGAEVEQLVLDAIFQGNTRVFERSGQGEEMMGTTVVVAVAHKGVLHLAHVGDSRAYLYEEGRLTQLTRDHSVVQELIDNGLITEEEALHHPEKNVITRALGVEREVDVSYSRRVLNPEAVVLLCTDGLTNLAPPEEIAQILDQSEFFLIPGALIHRALAAGGSDNVTVVVIQQRRPSDE